MLLILKEPDLGTSLVFLPVLLAMLFAGGARQRDLVRLVAAGLMLLPLLWSQMSHEQRSRITALWEQNGPRETATRRRVSPRPSQADVRAGERVGKHGSPRCRIRPTTPWYRAGCRSRTPIRFFAWSESGLD